MATFGSHIFYDLFLQGRRVAGGPWGCMTSLSVQFLSFSCSFRGKFGQIIGWKSCVCHWKVGFAVVSVPRRGCDHYPWCIELHQRTPTPRHVQTCPLPRTVGILLERFHVILNFSSRSRILRWEGEVRQLPILRKCPPLSMKIGNIWVWGRLFLYQRIIFSGFSDGQMIDSPTFVSLQEMKKIVFLFRNKACTNSRTFCFYCLTNITKIQAFSKFTPTYKLDVRTYPYNEFGYNEQPAT